MNKEILKLAIPNILSNISIPLLSTVDIILMGHLSGMHIGAVGVGSMIFNFVYWNFGFLRMGTTGITAQAYGQQDEEKISKTLGQALLVALWLALPMLLLMNPFADLGIYFMNVEGEQAQLFFDYFYIRIWAAPATLASFVIMGWFFGMQNAIYPLIWTLVANVTNIIANYILVKHYGMETDGVALGTVIAQYAGLLTGLILLFRKYSQYIYQIKWKTISKWNELKSFLTINRDIFIRTVCLTLTFSFFYSKSSAAGELALAVNTVLLQFLNWMSYGVDGFAYASESMVGKYFGAKEEAKTRKSIRLTFWWGMSFALIFSGIYWIGGEFFLSLFTNQVNVIQGAIPYLVWVIVLPLVAAPSYLWDGVYIGMTAAKTMRNLMLIAFIVFLGSYYFLNPIYGNHGLWFALFLFLFSRGIGQWVMFRLKGMRLQ